MSGVATKCESTVTKCWSMQISAEVLIDLLRKHVDPTIPADAIAVVEVPRGGDYSGMTLPIDDDTPLTVRWESIVRVNESA